MNYYYNKMDNIIDRLWENKEKDMEIIQTYKREKIQLRKDIAKFKEEDNEAVEQMDEYDPDKEYIDYLERQQHKLLKIIEKFIE